MILPVIMAEEVISNHRLLLYLLFLAVFLQTKEALF
jgi:hypothetical protein